MLALLRLPHRTAVPSDVVALLVFVAVGVLSHHGTVPALDYVRTALPIVGCWLLAAGVFDLYRRPRPAAFACTWLAGVTAGVLLRALVLWRLDAGDAAFLGVALSFTLLFVLAARAAARTAAILAGA